MLRRNLPFYFILIISCLFGNKSLTISKTNESILIDGFIDENEWIGAAIADGFYEVMPAENEPSITETQTFVTYDEKNLYVGFKAFDDPNEVRAHQSKRDAIWEDDMVGIILDPQNDGVMAYQFFCNPLGNQGDGQKFGQSEIDSWDAVWYSSGRVTDEGYEVEISIPFSTFRVSNENEYHWRISFFRITPRDDSRRQNSWTPFDRNNPCQICQLGHLYGIKNIDTRAPMELLPGLVGSYDDSLGSNIGLGISMPFGNSGTAEITLNPDFSQVESNASRIDLNSQFAIYYPETRPFFNEGIDLFNTGSFGWKPKTRTVYTRSINQPSMAAKVLGQVGNTQYGYLGAKDQSTLLIIPFGNFGGSASVGESISNIFRAKHSLNKGSFIGGILSDRRYENGSGTLGGLDGLYRFNNNLQLDWQLFISNTLEPNDTSLTSSINEFYFSEDSLTAGFDGESYTGYSAYASLERMGRNGGTTLMYVEKTPTFRADNGYVDLNDQRQFNWTNYRVFYPKSELFEQMEFVAAFGHRLFHDWSWAQDWTFLSHSAKLKGQFSYNITLLGENESYLGERFDNNYQLMFSFDKNVSKMISVELSPRIGTEIIRWADEPYQARNVGLGFEVDLKPSSEFKISLDINSSKSTDFNTKEEIYSDLISRLRLEYQATSALNFRFVAQYHDYERKIDIQPLISYQPDPFSIYYIGTSRSYERTGKIWDESFGQVYLKIQKLFSI
jgi:hypothetical protein